MVSALYLDTDRPELVNGDTEATASIAFIVTDRRCQTAIPNQNVCSEFFMRRTRFLAIITDQFPDLYRHVGFGIRPVRVLPFLATFPCIRGYFRDVGRGLDGAVQVSIFSDFLAS